LFREKVEARKKEIIK